MIPHAQTLSDANLDETETKFQLRSLKIPWYDHILLNRPLKVVLTLIIFAVAIPLLIYNFYFFTTFDMPPDAYSIGTCLIPRENRIPCGVGHVEQPACHPQCCYDLSSHFCFHRTPSRFSYIIDQPWQEGVRIYPRVATVPYQFQDSLPNIKLSVDERSSTHLVLRIYDPTRRSYSGGRLDDKKYVYEVSTPEMGIVVNSTSGTIFNMARGPLIASDNIWETSFILTNETMYGLGDIPLRENVTKILYNNEKGLASVPLIFARVNGTYHGLLIESGDPTEVKVHGENRIVVRSITNTGFTFHIFVGPRPKDIMRDVMNIIGRVEKLQYWMLGAHICNELPDEDLSGFLTKASAERLPFESICGHGPVVFDSNQCRDEVTNTDFENGADLVKRSNKKFIPHVSPYIRYHSEMDNDTETENTTEVEREEETEEVDSVDESNNTCGILPTYKNMMLRDGESFEIYRGVVDDEEVVYPNYEDACRNFMKDLWPYDVTPDGIILENNWPYDESEKILNETGLPYFSKDFQMAFKRTPQWNLVHSNSSESYLFKHQNYGNHFVNAFMDLFNESMILSSSQNMYGQIGINRQKIDTSWTNLRNELVATALGGVSGHWFWSSPICGDTDNFDIETHASLCVKWYMAGTYFPMMKIHSKSSPRHPLSFTGTHKALILKAVNDRTSFLPYFHTILQDGPLLRPMFYQFPETKALQDLRTQFSVGDDILIVPNLEPSQSHVHVWMPPGTWYEFWSGMKLNATEGEAVTLTTTESDFLTLIRGGSIVAIQQDTRESVEQTRWLSSFSVIVALECNGTCEASGSLFITDNMRLNFEANSQNLTMTAIGDDFDPICDWFESSWAYDVRKISVYGLPEEFNNFDNHREITNFIDLCLLETRDEIVVDLV